MRLERHIKEKINKMAAYDWVYYDTKDVGTSANTEKEFFAHTEAANGIDITNLGDANNLPGNETFEIHEIHIFNSGDLLFPEFEGLIEQGMLEIKVSGSRVLIIPAMLAGSNCYYYDASSDKTDTTDTGIASLKGEPFILQKPIIIKGAVPFNVTFTTGTGATGSGDSLIIALRGKLTRT